MIGMIKRLPAMIGGLLLACICMSAPQAQDDVTVYEYEPYRVKVWYCFDKSVTASEFSREAYLRDLGWAVDRTFAAAWSCSFQPAPSTLQPLITRDIDQAGIEQLSADDFVLLTSTENSKSKTIRTLVAALESLESIPVSSTNLKFLEQRLNQFPADDGLRALASKAATSDLLIADVLSGNQPALLLRKRQLPNDLENVRVLQTQLPGQIDWLLRSADKLMVMLISQKADALQVSVREFDCPMQYEGPVVTHTALRWESLARESASAMARAFAPVARVEDATSSSAELLLKAGGLILNTNNPASVHVGDLMHPIVRRDSRNGAPTLLQPQSWTFAAITDVASEELRANVYSYSNGPGLMGRRNRRTQRVLLKVRPVVDETEIEVVVRGTGKPQPGCFVYQRDLLTDEFTLLGQTDWRGRFPIAVPKRPVRVLPADVKQAKLRAQRELDALQAAEEQAKVSEASSETPESPLGEGSATNLAAEQKRQKLEEAVNTSDDEITLTHPLLWVYVKSGEQVLGSLSMVPGLKQVEVAELSDDTTRLEIEAFVRGFQVEIIDLIGLRNLLAARIKLHLKNDRIKEAEETLAELRALTNYSEMASRLVEIQSAFLDSGDLPRYAQLRVDRMFKSTRDLLQKYLQDGLVQESLEAIEAAKMTAASSADSSGEQP
ncbi:MAG TPA: hypothetical protein DDW52_27275 [Planctomycetaceae bacterium]|nr:hypothetical protein [Planctomycetaceae bacterium]